MIITLGKECYDRRKYNDKWQNFPPWHLCGRGGIPQKAGQMTNEYQITNKKNPKQKFDLEERTLTFSKNCINISKLLVMQVINIELIRQLIRSSTSVGANYREANEATTKKRILSPNRNLQKGGERKQILASAFSACKCWFWH